jgi:hypothetical protein
MIYRFFVTLCLVILSSTVMAQLHYEENPVRRKCGHDEYVHLLMQEDPGFADRRAMIEQQMIEWLKQNPPSEQGSSKVVYTIPVVVHVLYANSVQNIPHTRIIEQVNTLNQDFRKLNANLTNVPLAFANRVADVEFEFCLAQRDPQGYWTNGVTRKAVTNTSYSYNDDNLIKFTSQGGQSIWDPSKYMNIWVVNLTGGVLGYTQPPGGQASKDGIVICYKYFGSTGASAPFNKGRTATHEIGHWFNLIHIWGDDNGACWGSDFVNDTPNQASEFYGCPTFPQKDVCTPDSPGVMFMNYMDYVDDNCMMMFTNGQKNRMVSALNVYRAGLKTSDGCQPAISIDEVPDIADFTLSPNPSNGWFNIELILNTRRDVDIQVLTPLGQQLWSHKFNQSAILHETLNLSHLPAGVYIIQVVAGQNRISQKVVIQ